jgi:hypothetical protein
MSLLEMMQWLQDTNVGTSIRESIWTFPIIEGLHVLGLSISVGIVYYFDLRLLGFNMRGRSVSEVRNQILPWAIAGFVIMMITGGLLFWAQAAKAYVSIFGRIKFFALILAAINILVYHGISERTIAEWDKAPIPPMKARMAGLFSIILWTVVVAAGRLMAYTF